MNLQTAIDRLNKYESSKRITLFHEETMTLASGINRAPDSLAFEELIKGINIFMYDAIVDTVPQKAATAAIKMRMFLLMVKRDKCLDYWSMYRWSQEAKDLLIDRLLLDSEAAAAAAAKDSA